MSRPRVLPIRRDLAEHALRGGGAHRHDELGLDCRNFPLIPLPAGLDLRRCRFLVQADLSARHKFEMLHRVGDVDLVAIDAGFGQRTVEHLAGRADEGMAGEVFLVAGLLADQHDGGVLRAFAEHGLRRVLVERAGAAMRGLLAERFEIVGGSLACHRSLRPLLRLVRIGCGVGDHGAGHAFGILDQGFNDRGLGQVPPVFLRHLRLHRLHLQPRRIEDAGVVAPPGFLQPVFARRLALAHARRERERVAIPMRAEIGRQDRPGHVGKALGEERRGELDDVMLRLEPGDVMRGTLATDLAEAHEGVHLVLVAMDRSCHRRDLRDVRIGRDLDEIVIVLQPPEQAIEDRKTLGIAMQDGGIGRGRRILPTR